MNALRFKCLIGLFPTFVLYFEFEVDAQSILFSLSLPFGALLPFFATKTNNLLITCETFYFCRLVSVFDFDFIPVYVSSSSFPHT